MYAEDSHTCNSKKEALNFYVPFSYGQMIIPFMTDFTKPLSAKKSGSLRRKNARTLASPKKSSRIPITRTSCPAF